MRVTIRRQKPIEPIGQTLHVLRLALPNHQYAPTRFLQRREMASISATVAGEFVFPIFATGFRNAVAPFARMLMPEAAMYENDLS